jgi:hypothetical protein
MPKTGFLRQKMNARFFYGYCSIFSKFGIILLRMETFAK